MEGSGRSNLEENDETKLRAMVRMAIMKKA